MNTSNFTRLVCLLLILGLGSTLSAQDAPESKPEKEKKEKMAKPEKAAKPKDMLEVGIRPMYMFVGGDVEAEGGYGGAIHFRKALDYVFSVRFEGMYGDMKGSNDEETIQNRNFENNYIGGSGLAVVSLNNFKLDRGKRNTNIYAMVGAGANFFETTYNDFENGGRTDALIEREFAPHAAAGAGISFRLGDRVNAGVEYQAIIPFGSRADQIDGYDVGSNFRDIINTVGLNINFNLGNKSTASEPLYWVSPFNSIGDEIDQVAARVDDATKDSDGDGIVDAIDQEPNTPANVPVDTRGRTLDSDKDGIPDFRDQEPFFPPRPGEEVDENGVVTNRMDKPVTEERVQEMIDASIANARLNNTTTVTSDLRDLFIPMIYFPLNQYTVKYSDYGTLASLASVLKGNPSMRLVVRGFTDKVGNAAANERLSYLRANSVIEHMVNQHGINRSRFVLQYRGQDENIVPLNQTYLNRRVEFHTAEAGDYEQQPPANVNSGSGGF
ncbi:hypothetical protein CEQ90_00635 [Lewinellaceae bacterium SD302]|nr:hypothetical protein CEQ90_00635 [Lewinellaceae bacterium SD302]